MRPICVYGIEVDTKAYLQAPRRAHMICSPAFQQSKGADHMAEKTLKKGDHVSWDASQGKVEGEVVRKVTSTAKVKGHTAKASKEEPQYEVKSDKTGTKAIHKPEELKKSTTKKST
jgi:hypothetical protein